MTLAKMACKKEALTIYGTASRQQSAYLCREQAPVLPRPNGSADDVTLRNAVRCCAQQSQMLAYITPTSKRALDINILNQYFPTCWRSRTHLAA